MTKGIAFLFKKNKITAFTGKACIEQAGLVSIIDGQDKGRQIKTKNIVIATGSAPAELGEIKFDEKHIISSTGALELTEVPEHLLVVGAGVIGLELGSVWSRLGAKVSVVEFLPRILPGFDQEVAKNAQRILTRQGLKFMLSNRLDSVDIKADKIVAKLVETATGKKEGRETLLECEKILIATGRRPYTNDLGLEKLGIKLDKRGFIETNAQFETNIPHIYAIGDCRPGPMLAHKGEDEGIAVAENISGLKGHVDEDMIPGVVYTEPEIATIGLSEEQLKERSVDYKIGKFSFVANSRAKANHTTQGFIKILSASADDRILGAHIIGSQAGELIHQIVTVMEFGGSSEDIARMCHAHPTLSEAVKEAALAVEGRPIHA